MPRFKTHLIIGVAAGSAYSFAIQRYRQSLNPNLPHEINPVHVALCSLAAAIGGCVPDAFEPADRKTGPNHRGKLHSFAVGAVAVKGAHFLAFCETGSVNERWLADIAGAFYAGYVFRAYSDRGGQVFVSTHSPSFLNAVELDEVFWIQKSDGYSKVLRARADAQITALMAAGDKMGYLWSQGFFKGASPR